LTTDVNNTFAKDGKESTTGEQYNIVNKVHATVAVEVTCRVTSAIKKRKQAQETQ